MPQPIDSPEKDSPNGERELREAPEFDRRLLLRFGVSAFTLGTIGTAALRSGLVYEGLTKDRRNFKEYLQDELEKKVTPPVEQIEQEPNVPFATLSDISAIKIWEVLGIETLSIIGKTLASSLLKKPASTIGISLDSAAGYEPGERKLEQYEESLYEQERFSEIEELDRDGVEKSKLESIMELTESTITAPISEEFMFRLIPSMLLKQDGSSKWTVGVPICAAFAFSHNLTRDHSMRSVRVPGTNDIYFSLEHVPLQQFMAGLIYWYLMRTRGFGASLLAHSAGNASAHLFPQIASSLELYFHDKAEPDKK